MGAYRASVGETEHYTSLSEMRKAWGLKPVVKQTKDESKLMTQRETFGSKHLCPACKRAMTYVGGNILTCTNEKCNGEKHEFKNEETGEARVWYTPVYNLLDERGAEIAANIFA